MSVPKATELATIVAVRVTLADPSIETFPDKSPPKVINLELVHFAAEPVYAFADNTSVPLILITFPEARSIFSEEVQDPVLLLQLKVLSVAPFSVIPPPSAVMLDGEDTLASSMFLSSTKIDSAFTVTVVPLTVRFPETTKFPET